MSALHLKLAGSLVAGGLAGVAALVTMTSTTSPQLTPAGDSTTSTQSVVESSAPCPAGTVERDDVCVQTVEVAAPVAQEDAQDEPVVEATEAPAAPVVLPPAAPAAPAAQPVTGSEDEHESDATEVEHESDATEVDHQDEQPDAETHEQESDD